MQKSKRKTYFLTGCLVLTVLLLCGCTTQNDLEIVRDDTASQDVAAYDAAPQEQLSQVQDTASQEDDSQVPQTEPPNIYVQIVGAIRHPGVYEMPSGSRVFEVVEKAGGMTEDAAVDAVNQALPVADGDMIVLYTKQEWEQSRQELALAEHANVDGADSQEGEMAGDGKVNINTADVGQLCTIAGIGEVRAQSIVEYRQQHGLFQTIDEIKNVPGIKEGLFEKIKDKIKV